MVFRSAPLQSKEVELSEDNLTLLSADGAWPEGTISFWSTPPSSIFTDDLPSMCWLTETEVTTISLACFACQQRTATVYDLESETPIIHGALKHIQVDLDKPFKATKVNKFVPFEGVEAAV